MEDQTKLFQAPIEPEGSLVSKRGGRRVIHISFDGQRRKLSSGNSI